MVQELTLRLIWVWFVFILFTPEKKTPVENHNGVPRGVRVKIRKCNTVRVPPPLRAPRRDVAAPFLYFYADITQGELGSPGRGGRAGQSLPD